MRLPVSETRNFPLLSACPVVVGCCRKLQATTELMLATMYNRVTLRTALKVVMSALYIRKTSETIAVAETPITLTFGFLDFDCNVSHPLVH